MSRLRRLKERKRRNKIKFTACSLALILSICSSQLLGTYAFFKDSEDINSDLSISIGNVNVDVGEDINFENLEKGKEYKSNDLYIKNQGTLRQKIYLKIPKSSSFLDEIDCKIELNYNGNIKTINLSKNLDNYIDTGFILDCEYNKNIITYKFIMNVKDSTNYATYNSSEKLKLNLEVMATQIGELDFSNRNYGFYDIDTQEITASIKTLDSYETNSTIVD